MTDKIQNLIDYYITQNNREQNLQLNAESLVGQKEFEEFVDNYDKIRLNNLSNDHPDFKGKMIFLER